MSINKCRICKNELFRKPLIRYKNMPKTAQFFPDIKSFRKDKGIILKIFQCSGCGLVQLKDAPVFYYKDVIRATNISEEMKVFRTKQFNNFINKFYLKNKKIIEIGCGFGDYLSILNKTGVDAYGLENSTESVKKCRKNKMNVLKGFIKNTNYKIKYHPFDAFLMLNFLEHLPDPNSALRGIYNNLKDNAVGIIEVPNSDIIFKNNLFSEFISDHLSYFTKETFKTALNINGFEIIKCDNVWHNYIISAFVRKKKKIETEKLYRQKDKIKKEIEKYISRFKNNRVAVWGAGHQALAAISLFDLEGKIKYIVDSAPFKQNKFTPATHIPIFSSEKLRTNSVDAVIIMAASYSDEVAKTIKKEFSNINIAILRDFGLEEIRNY